MLVAPTARPTAPPAAAASGSTSVRKARRQMNYRKAVAAAFGAALLGAGTSAVVGGPAHAVLSSNSTGTAKNVNKGSGGLSSATCTDCSASIGAVLTASKVAGVHQGG